MDKAHDARGDIRQMTFFVRRKHVLVEPEVDRNKHAQNAFWYLRKMSFLCFGPTKTLKLKDPKICTVPERRSGPDLSAFLKIPRICLVAVGGRVFSPFASTTIVTHL